MGFVGQFSQVLDLQRSWKQDDLFEQDSQGGVVITISGVVEEHEEALVGKKSGGNVLFKISEAPAGKVFLDLMNRMMGQRSDILGEDGQRLYANTMGGAISTLPALEVCSSPNVLISRLL
jgi:septum formation inhibitor-activating ATPase MinD